MKEENQPWHNDTISTFQADMFVSLVHAHNVVSESLRMFTFEDEHGSELPPLKGYLAAKEINGRVVKYFIDEEQYRVMPIRVTKTEDLFLKESSTKKLIVKRPLSYNKFTITPEQTFGTGKDFITSFANFEHTNPKAWTAMKYLAVAGVVCKVFLGISSPSEFGKSGLFNIIHGITQKSIVYQPRTEAGVLLQINENGNMVFDEVCDCNAAVKKIIGAFTLIVADGRPQYHNGAVRAAYLKQIYDITQQSITFIYNYKDYYKEVDDFFDNMFGNNPAIHSRMLKFKFDGKLTESFRKDFDIPKVAEENKMRYIRMAKYILWLKDLRKRNAYDRRWVHVQKANIHGRKRLIYDEITWLVDFCSESQEEYQEMIDTFDIGIADYEEMVGISTAVKEETVLEWDNRATVWTNCSVCNDTPCNEGSDGKHYCRKHLK